MITRSKNASLLAVGSVALDDIHGPYGYHPDLLGGSAAYFAVAASYFSKSVSLVAVVGEDFSQHHIDYLKARGIDVSGLERQRGETFHWVGKYADDLETRETIETRLGVFGDFRPKLDEIHKKAQLLFLGNIHPALQSDVLRQVDRPRLVAADTMNFWITGHREALGQTLRDVSLLIINDEEARLLSGERNLVRAANKITAMGPRSIVIKRGDAGALLRSEGGFFFSPALPLEDVRDPTGAGDSFAGGFMGYLAYAGTENPETVREAMIAGSVMASFSVEQFSLDGLRNLTQEMIQERCDAFSRLSQFQPLKL